MQVGKEALRKKEVGRFYIIQVYLYSVTVYRCRIQGEIINNYYYYYYYYFIAFILTFRLCTGHL